VSAFGRSLSLLVIIVALTGSIPALTGVPARGEDIDRGKSGAQLFAASCVPCHQSPRGLAKDRFGSTLSSFLQQHYTSSHESAQVLTAYLQSVDRGRPTGQAAAGKSRAPAANVSEPSPSMSAPWASLWAPSLRPPAPIPPSSTAAPQEPPAVPRRQLLTPEPANPLIGVETADQPRLLRSKQRPGSAPQDSPTPALPARRAEAAKVTPVATSVPVKLMPFQE
jgi:mono/diheme cytochrome c family protein